MRMRRTSPVVKWPFDDIVVKVQGGGLYHQLVTLRLVYGVVVGAKTVMPILKALSRVALWQIWMRVYRRLLTHNTNFSK